MTSLLHELQEQIQACGPIRMHDYMNLCLHHSKHGYYKKDVPIGRDFVTSPEISPLFGQSLGIWALQQWMKLGQPEHWQLIELGPGRGTLMVDVLQILNHVPEAFQGLRITMVDSNPHFVQMQKDNLRGYSNVGISWVADYSELGISAPHVVIANEFLDALPVQSYVHRQGNFWPETITTKEESLCLACADVAEALPVEWRGSDTYVDGDVVEVCPGFDDLLRSVSTFASPGEYAFIDYGYTQPQRKPTIQAIQNHSYVDVCAQPGDADITAHVNFSAFCALADKQGFQSELTSQRLFLKENGIDLRLQKIIQSHEERREQLTHGYNRLIDVMGDLFQVALLHKR